MPYPDPADKKDWNNRPAWAGSSGKKISYEACRKADREAQRAAGINVAKATHGWRQFSARMVDDAGCSPEARYFYTHG